MRKEILDYPKEKVNHAVSMVDCTQKKPSGDLNGTLKSATKVS